MRKAALILALAVLALFTQCKKQENTGDNEQGNGIKMELTADNGGSKTSFGANGSIAWNTNEKIYVVTNGQCVGYVTNGSEGGNTFTGTLNISSGTYDFHYYYVGNTQTIAIGATDFTMDFSDQDGTLANLGDFHVGYGLQTDVEVTEGETIMAQASMKSLVAMAYFNIAGMAETGEKVFFYGSNINNKMAIDFTTNAPTFGKVDNEKDNYICAGTVAEGATSPCYVVLLPNHTDGTEEMTTNITFVSKRTTGTCNDVFNYGIIGGRFYCSNGVVDTPIEVSATSYQKGTLRGEFAVNSEGAVVHFSQANLTYTISTATWSFLNEQYDIVETNGQDVGNNYENQDVVSLFEWGTGNNPTTTSQNYGFIDWGTNAISNGGNVPNLWRTPTKDEYNYMFATHESDVTYAFGEIEGNNGYGMIMLPDNWRCPAEISLRSTSTGTHVPPVYSVNEWEKMEAAGAVYWPTAGYRYKTTVTEVGYRGQYRLSSTDEYGNSREMGFVPYYYFMTGSYEGGYSVRLVHNAE